MTIDGQVRRFLALCLVLACAGCAKDRNALPDSPFAPTIDPDGDAVDGMIVGHRLMQAGENHMALEAFTRAAAERGLTAEVLVALGSANLALGRMNQSEKLLRRAIEVDPAWPEAWNNLGVVLIERDKLGEAAQVFERAYALDNGESDAIRDNLRLALAKLENKHYGDENTEAFKLVRHGNSQYQIRRNDV